MPKLATTFVIVLFTLGIAHDMSAEEKTKPEANKEMKLGNFSISLAVKDIRKSKAFYEKLGFRKVGGKIEQNWLVLQNDRTTVGLFQGMFPKNMLTFNPGWNHNKETLKGFMDVREIQARLEQSGIKITTRADVTTKGPASFVIVDPDGNPILFDQHVPAPGNKPGKGN